MFDILIQPGYSAIKNMFCSLSVVSLISKYEVFFLN